MQNCDAMVKWLESMRKDVEEFVELIPRQAEPSTKLFEFRRRPGRKLSSVNESALAWMQAAVGSSYRPLRRSMFQGMTFLPRKRRTSSTSLIGSSSVAPSLVSPC